MLGNEPDKVLKHRPMAVLDLIGRSFIGGAAVCYVTGFFIQTLHLSRYGISDASPLRAEYVLTGCAALVPLILPAITLLILISAFCLWKMKKPDEKILRALRTGSFAFLLSPLLMIIASVIVYARILSQEATAHGIVSLGWTIFSVYFAFAAVAICAAVVTGEVRYRKITYKAPRTLALGVTVSCSLLPIFALLDYTDSYVKVAHPRIAGGLGGARPIRMQLLFNPDDRPHFIEEESPGCSLPLLLHAQSESCYLVTVVRVAPMDPEFLQIRKDQVLGLRLLPKQN